MQPILSIDLTSGDFTHLAIPQLWEKDYLGGASLAARILYDYISPELGCFDSTAPLLFLTGPLTGTLGPSVGRFVVCGLSPATGLWAESNCGGFWGPELRFAGFDGILVTGKASDPVYIWIEGTDTGKVKVEVRNASHFWGMDTYQIQTAICEENYEDKVKVASIGLAGQNKINFANIMCDHGRAAGRTGLGAVMGSKNLKAIAVKGTGQAPLVDPYSYSKLRARGNQILSSDPVINVLSELGTASATEYFHYLGEMPMSYFTKGIGQEELKISGAHIAETILNGRSNCHGCVIRCGRIVRLEDGTKRKGPEYETLVGFGPNLGLNDPVVATRLGDLCDRYGLDVVSMSNTIGLAFTLFEEGIINEADTGGFSLQWGNAVMVEQLIHQTIRHQGLGAYLAEGSRAFARRYGVENKAVQVNGLESPYHDPRGFSGMALVYATSPRGACHNQSDYYMVELGKVEESLGLKYFSPHSGAEKAGNVVRHQDWRSVINSLVMCYYSTIPPEMIIELIRAATGIKYQLADMIKIGERSWNLKRVINNRLGLTSENDVIPKAFLVPYRDDPDQTLGVVPEFNEMLQAYYLVRDWDPKTGYPNPKKLSGLGLEWAIKDIW